MLLLVTLTVLENIACWNFVIEGFCYIGGSTELVHVPGDLKFTTFKNDYYLWQLMPLKTSRPFVCEQKVKETAQNN